MKTTARILVALALSLLLALSLIDRAPATKAATLDLSGDGSRSVPLHLPSGVTRAVIFNRQFVRRHVQRDYESGLAPRVALQFSAMQPTSIHLIGHELVIVWSDGHESYYSGEELRRNCPCANCAGEADLFGRISRGAPPSYSPQSFDLAAAEPTGNYALTLRFADGHDWGIWTWDRLRQFCACDPCRSARAVR